MAIGALITTAVPENVLTLLRTMMLDQQLSHFYLVGGTSLALRIGHRMSVDIDLFTHVDFDADGVGDSLVERYAATALEQGNNTIHAIIENIKVDLIAHKYPLIEAAVSISGIRMAGLKDIAAMKINAISKRGAKKDFWDYAALLTYFSTEEMLTFFMKKYPAANAWHAEKSLAFFDDAENEPDPRDIGNRTWHEIKQIVGQSLKL